MKNILLIATGGTIACGQTENGLKPVRCGQSLVPGEAAGTLRTETLDLFLLDSADFSPAHWKKLHGAVTEAVFSGKYDGVVIFHGTDTLDYTAALLWHTIKPQIPVLLTGSMLPMDADESDAPRNAADALCCAEDPTLAGVYVIFGGRIIGGNEAVKRCSGEADAFQSFSGSDCGTVRGGKAVLLRKSAPDRILPFPENGGRIAVIKLSPFTDESDLRAEKCAGAVLESYGAGGLPARLCPAARRLAEKMPVILTTPCAGGVRLDEYEAGRRALECGIRSGGGMTTACAAVRLFLETGGEKTDRTDFYDQGI